jgi:predicted dehydrogenase
VADTRIGMGLVGAGFVGPLHVDAVRRLGFVDVVAVAGSSEDAARAAARRLGLQRSYAHYEALLDDPRVHVVHVATPNHLHYPVTAAAIARGKHVVSEKPLALNAGEAQELLDLACEAGIVHAVMFNYRGNPLVQEARSRILRGEIGRLHFLHGRYLQDWLLEDIDYSWRLEPDKGGASAALGDIGSHWCDLAEHVSGLRIVEVLGETTTAVKRRRKPHASREAFAAAGGDEPFEWVDIVLDDLASVLLRFDTGATGTLSIGQVCAGHKNNLEIELSGASGSIAWRQEHANELWIGHRHGPNEVLQKDPSLMDARTRGYARLPGGHHEGWADALFNVTRDIYCFIAAGKQPASAEPPLFATFEDGVRAARVVDAVLASAKAGGVWTRV